MKYSLLVLCLFLCGCPENRTYVVVKSEKEKSPSSEIELIESGLIDRHYYRLFKDRKSDKRIFYYGNSMVILPE